MPTAVAQALPSLSIELRSPHARLRRSIGRLQFLCAILLWVGLLSIVQAKNIVLVVVDDHGLDAGCYGNSVIQTPNLDRLAREGTVFTQAFCTTASCSASRSVILTGLHNHANGQFGHEHSYHNFSTYPDIRSLPVRLADAGYRTARIGKYHVQPESVYRFETVLGGNQGGPRNPVSMAERCRDFLRTKDDRPFFLYFCPSDPHRGGGFATHLPHAPDYFGNHMKYEGVNERVYDPAKVVVPPWLPDTLATRAEIAQYYQSVSRVDQGLGRLMDILKETGHWKETLVVYTSDNGSAFPGSKTTLYDPGMQLPLVIRHPEAQTRGIQNDSLISWVDLAPTLLDYADALTEEERVPIQARAQHAGRPAPKGFHGRSFLPWIDQESRSPTETIFASHTFHEITMYYPMRVVRTRNYKYILNLAHALPYPFATDLWAAPTWQSVYEHRADFEDGGRFGLRRIQDFIQRPREELYLLNTDPNEVRNRSDDSSVAEILAEARRKVLQFQEDTGDPWILKHEYE